MHPRSHLNHSYPWVDHLYTPHTCPQVLTQPNRLGRPRTLFELGFSVTSEALLVRFQEKVNVLGSFHHVGRGNSEMISVWTLMISIACY